MNRGLITSLAVLSTALLTACGSAASPSSQTSTSLRPVTNGAASGSGSGSSTSTSNAAIARCRTSQLDVTMASDGAAGSVRLTLTFTNTGAASCFLYGYPGLGLLDASGAPLPTHVLRTPSVVVPEIAERRVVLVPGGHAHADAGFSDVDPQPCRSAAALEVTPPDAYSHRVVAARIAPCGGIFHVSPVFR